MANFNTFEQAIAGVIASEKKPVVIDFYATWCGPCKMFGPIFDKATKELEGEMRLIKVDIDQMPNLASEYEVMSVPTIMVFENGKIKKQRAGATGLQTSAKIKEWVHAAV